MSLFDKARAAATQGDVLLAFRVYQKAACERIQCNVEQAKNAEVITDFLIRVSRANLYDSHSIVQLDICSCAICFGLLAVPCTLPCGHTFCKSCVVKSDSKVCKLCLKRYSSVLRGNVEEAVQHLKVNIIMGNIIEKLYSDKLDVINLKNEGNELLRRGKYEDAIQKYSEALAEEKNGSDDHLVYSNRSYAYMCVEDYQEALSDCMKTISFHPLWAKGYFRQGKALGCLSETTTSCLSYLNCLALDGSITPARQEVNRLISQALSSDAAKSGCKLDIPAVLHKLEHDYKAHGSNSEVTGDRSDKGLDVKWGDLYKVNTDLIEATDFECPLCVRLLLSPVATPCGHTFCRACLDRNLDHRPLCPICKHPLHQYLMERRQDTVAALELFIQTHLPEAFAERCREHDSEMLQLNSVLSGADIPIFVCTAAYPGVPCPLHIFEPRYRLMMRQCQESGSGRFGMCLPAPPPQGAPADAHGSSSTAFADYGTLLEIQNVEYLRDGRALVLSRGCGRFRVLGRGMRDGYHTATVRYIRDVVPDRGSPQYSDLLSVHDHVYSEVCGFLDSLGAHRRRQLEGRFGPLPEKPSHLGGDDGGEDGGADGPEWMWYIVNIITHDHDTICFHLKESEVKLRLEQILRSLAECRRTMSM